jgi:hypothetical protein
MSSKMTCPVCDSRTSAVFGAVMDDQPCPHCGAPASVIVEVNALREQQADQGLKARVEELLIELGKVTTERDRLARIVEGVRYALDA